MAKIRINLANPQELCELPDIDTSARDAILRHRDTHGPIRDAAELTGIMGVASLTPGLLEHIDFTPADSTAPEAPGA